MPCDVCVLVDNHFRTPSCARAAASRPAAAFTQHTHHLHRTRTLSHPPTRRLTHQHTGRDTSTPTQQAPAILRCVVRAGNRAWRTHLSRCELSTSGGPTKPPCALCMPCGPCPVVCLGSLPPPRLLPPHSQSVWCLAPPPPALSPPALSPPAFSLRLLSLHLLSLRLLSLSACSLSLSGTPASPAPPSAE